MNASNINGIMRGTPKKDTITTVIKVLSAVYLIMNIVRLGKELTKNNKEERAPKYL